MSTTDINDLFHIALIDTKHKERIHIKLVDQDGDEVSVSDVIQSVTEYVMDKMKDENRNTITNEIFPLMSHAAVAGMTKLLGAEAAAWTLSNESTRYGFINMMMVGFATLKFIQKKNLKIVTTRTPVSDEEMESLARRSMATDAVSKAAMLGITPATLLGEMIKQGSLKSTDLEQLGLSKEAAEAIISKAGTKTDKGEVN